MHIVNIHEAKTTLSKLLSEVEGGDEVLIARNGTPVARLTRVESFSRTPGIAADLPAVKAWRYDPAVFAPLETDEDLASEGWPV